MVEQNRANRGEAEMKKRVVQIGTISLGEGMPKVCVPVMGKDVHALEDAAMRAEQADLLELRLDSVSPEMRQDLLCEACCAVRKAGKPVLATMRTARDGGAGERDAEKYEVLLNRLIREKLCDAVDVELSIGDAAFLRIAGHAHAEGLPVVGSYHDFEGTPAAEEMAVGELKQIGKPFIVVVNTIRPYAMETQELCRRKEEKYDIKCLPFNCDQLKQEDIQKIMATMLLEFPVSQIDFYTPKWFDLLPEEGEVKTAVADTAREYLMNVRHLKDVRPMQEKLTCPYIKKCFIETVSMSDGKVIFHLEIDQKYYYELLSEWMGMPVKGDYAFYRILRQLSENQTAYSAVSQAVESARAKGYGVVAPEKAEVLLEPPVLIKHGNRYGFKIKAKAPSIHMIKAGIETEIAPIVGDQAQAEELITSMNNSQEQDPKAIWDTLIFGKTVGQLVEEGIQTKVTRMSENSQVKMQEAIQKIVNDGNGSVIFIII